MTLEESLDKSWNNVRTNLGYHNIPYPVMIDPKDDDELRLFSNEFNVPTMTAAINMENHEIMINKNFLNELIDNGLSKEDALSGILHHEVNHYVYCPQDLLNFLRFNSKAAKISPTHANVISNYFQDVVDNLDLLQNKDGSCIEKVYRCMDKEHNLDKLMAALYQKRSGIPMNVKIRNRRLKKKLNALDALDYSNKKNGIIHLKSSQK